MTFKKGDIINLSPENYNNFLEYTGIYLSSSVSKSLSINSKYWARWKPYPDEELCTETPILRCTSFRSRDEI